MRFGVLPFVLFLSPEATLLEFEFDGQLLTDSGADHARSYIIVGEAP